MEFEVFYWSDFNEVNIHAYLKPCFINWNWQLAIKENISLRDVMDTLLRGWGFESRIERLFKLIQQWRTEMEYMQNTTMLRCQCGSLPNRIYERAKPFLVYGWQILEIHLSLVLVIVMNKTRVIKFCSISAENWEEAGASCMQRRRIFTKST